MSEYVELFKEEIEQISKANENELYKEIRDRMKRYWHTIPNLESEIYDVIGVDSSNQSIELSNGYVLLVARACAVSKEKKRTLMARLTTGDITELKSRVMEHLEHKILRESLREVNLVDGSLYGRGNHVPAEFRNEGFENFILDYYEEYVSLMEEIEKNNLKILGISKSTSSTFYRDIIVKEMYDEEINKLQLGGKEKELPYLALDKKREAMQIAKRLLKDRGYERAYLLITELMHKRPDLSFISTLGPGISDPVLLGASARSRRRFKEISQHEKKALEEIFSSKEIKDTDVKTVLKYLNLPAFVSFYISFTPGVVLRVDFPAFMVGLNRRMMGVYWPEIIKEDISEIIKIVISEHADNYVHSIHLFAADSDVRFTREIFMNVYLPILENTLHTNPAMGDMRYLFRR